ncbi:FAS1-like dehydratase domain-containing protein [Nocardia otitidiscaviarum]|uniref:FAS1-like dehydratase domain-containing protein n=1 Tax=Nocardia otitidiscaviarum TaxID=1823 RepID=UPI002455D565|nr:MaoC family dehydratase N-terminal domain-containing protein [Nocardia otitidiscaviarum]
MSNTVASAAGQARALVGHHYRCAEPFRVERTRIREFARAVQAYHPAHWREAAAARLGFDAVVAPPSFAALIWQQARREILRTLITGYRLDRIVHVDQTLEIGRPLLAGDVLTCDIYFESFRQFHDFDVITINGVLTDQHGMPVQTGSTALLARTAPPEGPHSSVCTRAGIDREPSLAPVRRLRRPRTRVDLDRLTVDTVLPTAATTLTRRDLTTYARAVGDLDMPERAASAGQPVVVAPGILVLALTAGYLTSWTGDPAAVTTYRAEFANQVHYLAVPRADAVDIEFSGRVVACDRIRRTATVSLDAISQGRRLFGYASAEVRFPPPAARHTNIEFTP